MWTVHNLFSFVLFEMDRNWKVTIVPTFAAVLAVYLITKYVKSRSKPKQQPESKSKEEVLKTDDLCCKSDEGCGEESCDCKAETVKKPKKKKGGRRVVGNLPKPKNIR